eukprot:1393244-Amorphochlora_amoeboformis.AAC.1
MAYVGRSQILVWMGAVACLGQSLRSGRSVLPSNPHKLAAASIRQRNGGKESGSATAARLLGIFIESPAKVDCVMETDGGVYICRSLDGIQASNQFRRNSLISKPLTTSSRSRALTTLN